jgi:hypothetical protein
MHDLRRDRIGAGARASLNRIGDDLTARRAVDHYCRENTRGLGQLPSQAASTALWCSNRPGLACGTRRLIS